MENVLSLDFQEWCEQPVRTGLVDSYVRKPKKILRCRNLDAHADRHAAGPAKISLAGAALCGKLRVQRASRARLASAVRQLAHTSAQAITVEARFRKLAEEWSREIGSASSVGVMTSHPKYREIVGLGWDVVPLLLSDLRAGRGFWFTALAEITGIRPFDPRDAGRSKRMSEAWIRWGKRKGII